MRIALCHERKMTEVEPLLPLNYRVIGRDIADGFILIGGEDNAGWTLDGYVIPRLGSSLVYTEEIK
jgi:hypothetical protein